MNRIVEYYKRPQVQERLTMQIVQELQNALVQKTLPALLTQNISV
jgi:GTP cyclohydrolase I